MNEQSKHELEMVDDYISNFEQMRKLDIRIKTIQSLMDGKNTMLLLSVKMFTYLLGLYVVLIKIDNIFLKTFLIMTLMAILSILFQRMMLKINFNMNQDEYEEDMSVCKRNLASFFDRYKSITEIDGFPPFNTYTLYNLQIIKECMLEKQIDIKSAIDSSAENLIYPRKEHK